MRGKPAALLPTSSPHRVELLDQKRPRYSPGGGGRGYKRLVHKTDLIIKEQLYKLYCSLR